MELPDVPIRDWLFARGMGSMGRSTWKCLEFSLVLALSADSELAPRERLAPGLSRDIPAAVTQVKLRSKVNGTKVIGQWVKR